MQKVLRAPSGDKFAERRAELGEAALQALAKLGYARTSLREIAQHSDFSHGVLHYYFSDKVDLILFSVAQYKARCVTRYDGVIASSSTHEELLEGFLAALAQTVRGEATMHRLWYDLRSQALFETAFRDEVAAIDRSLENMVWRIVSRLAELAGAPVTAPSHVVYAMFDGLFQQCLFKHIAGDRKAVASLLESVRMVVDRLLVDAAPAALPVPRRAPRLASPRAAVAAVPARAGRIAKDAKGRQARQGQQDKK